MLILLAKGTHQHQTLASGKREVLHKANLRPKTISKSSQLLFAISWFVVDWMLRSKLRTFLGKAQFLAQNLHDGWLKQILEASKTRSTFIASLRLSTRRTLAYTQAAGHYFTVQCNKLNWSVFRGPKKTKKKAFSTLCHEHKFLIIRGDPVT